MDNFQELPSRLTKQDMKTAKLFEEGKSFLVIRKANLSSKKDRPVSCFIIQVKEALRLQTRYDCRRVEGDWIVKMDMHNLKIKTFKTHRAQIPSLHPGNKREVLYFIVGAVQGYTTRPGVDPIVIRVL